MKKIFFINDTAANRISFYHLAAFLAALPFDFFYSEIILVSFGVHTLLHTSTRKLPELLSKTVLVPVSIYLLGIVAISYSTDKAEAFNITGRQLAMLLFPVLFVLTDIDLKKYRYQLICIFGFTCTLTILYLYFDAIKTMHYFHLPLTALFTSMFLNHNFSLPIQIHATYLAAYTAFSLAAFIYLLIKKEEFGGRWIFIIASVILFAGMVQLSSRSVFIAFLFIVNLVFPFFLFSGRKRVTVFLLMSIFSASVLFLITRVDSFKTRYISELKTDLTDNVKIIENTEPRLVRWSAIVELVRLSPVVGYGTGAEKKLLKQKYFEKGLYNSYLNEFNTHSEYLSILLRTGFLGLALFICILFFGFRYALTKKDTLFFGFMCMVTIICISENMLDLNKGIFFYSFFFSMFLWPDPKKQNEQSRYLTKKEATSHDVSSFKNKEKEISDVSSVSSYNHVQ